MRREIDSAGRSVPGPFHRDLRHFRGRIARREAHARTPVRLARPVRARACARRRSRPMAGSSPTCAASDDDKDSSICGATTSAAQPPAARRFAQPRAPSALSAEEEARRERQRTAAFSGIVEYSSPPTAAAAGPARRRPVRVRPRRGAARARCGGSRTAKAYETDARFSPRARYVSFVRNQNLWVIDLEAARNAPHADGGGRSASAWRSSSRRRKWTATPATGGRRTIGASPSRAWTNRRSPKSSATRSRPTSTASCTSAIRPPARPTRACELYVAALGGRTPAADRSRRRSRHLPRARRLVPGRPPPRRPAPEPRPEDARPVRRRRSPAAPARC